MKHIFLSLLCICTMLAKAQDSGAVHLADPAIFLHNGMYYLYGTVEGRAGEGFQVYTSTGLAQWTLSAKNGGYALKKGDAFGTAGFWAPQVFQYRDSFYMAYVANESIAVAVATDPLGPFTQRVKEPLAAPVRQIDPFVFMDEGKIYLYHVRLTGGNKIFVAEMTDDLAAIRPETLRESIIATDQWENTANTKWPVTEGPSVFKHNGLYYLVYTANDFRHPDYAVGYATSKSPLGPWEKYSGNPVLHKNMISQHGTGHGDFFRDNNGGLQYVFHTHYSLTKVGPRRTAILKASLNGNRLVMDAGSFQFLKQ
ncbi:beta-xylosidase [Chitinophaga lutea]|uniref:Beta-xylosidase n=1 Tax=Chitinophaga lutea TaxID=2488634 RepID=A0A3N4PLJ7_9BACT|nr:glycoside hydrolase family 43 protein [Chitinophaga lutea]RPE05751.1 beta-xylosidase [Chitinophaga lutea]